MLYFKSNFTNFVEMEIFMILTILKKTNTNSYTFDQSKNILTLDNKKVNMLDIHTVVSLWSEISQRISVGERLWTKTGSNFDDSVAIYIEKVKGDTGYIFDLIPKTSKIGVVFSMVAA